MRRCSRSEHRGHGKAAGRGHESENRRSASTNGTARKITPGHERGHRHRHPDLLGAALDGLDQLAVDVAPDRARLVGDQPAQVTGTAVQGQHVHEPAQGVDVGDLGPLAQRLDLGQALADPPAPRARGRARTRRRRGRRGERAPPRASTPRPAACRAARPPPGARGRSAAANGTTRSPSCCSTSRNASSRAACHEPEGQRSREPRGPGDHRAAHEPGQRPRELADPEPGDVERRVHPLEADGERLGHAERPRQPLADRAGERARRPGANDSADMTEPRRRAAAPPGTYGASRSTSGRRRNQRSSLRRRVRPGEQRQRHQGRGATRSLVEHPLLVGQGQQAARPQPATARPRRCRRPPSPARTAFRRRRARCRCSSRPAPSRTARAA